MKVHNYSLVLLLAVLAGFIGCSQSDTNNPTPTPTPVPDYSSCKYTLTYKLSYSALNKNRPTTVSYLDSDQKLKTAVLSDTSFALTMNYKYGDSVYVRLSPGIYFLNVGNGAKNKLSKAVTFASQTSTCPDFRTASESQSATLDSIPAAGQATVLRAYGVSPVRLTK